MQSQKIEFRKERDFGSILGDAIRFIKQNFRSFFGSVILLVGPFILINGIIYGYIQTTIRSVAMDPMRAGNLFDGDYFFSIGLLFMLSLFTNILLSSLVYNYMCIYNEMPEGYSISVSEVGKRVWSNIGRLTGSFMAFLVLSVIVVLAIVLIFIGLGSMLGVGFSILLGFLTFFAMAIFLPVIMYWIPAGFFVVVRDNLFIFNALGKVRRYLSGNFWWTWLVMVVTLIALGIIQTIFNLPASIITLMDSFSRMKGGADAATEQSSSVLLISLYTFGLFFSTCTYTISHLISAFNFLSHEEKHEGKGLLSRIDEIN